MLQPLVHLLHSFIDVGVCRAVSHNCCHYSLLPVQHLTLLKYIFPSTSNFATGLSCVLHWVFWSCLCPAQGSPWPFLTKATPAASTLPVPYILHPVFDANELTRTESKTAGVGVKAEECFTDLFDE